MRLVNLSKKVEVKEAKDTEEDNEKEESTRAKGQRGWGDWLHPQIESASSKEGNAKTKLFRKNLT